MLLEELDRALGHKKLASRVSEDEREELILLLRRAATFVEDPGTPPPVRSADPGADYVIALAAAQQALIVSGDPHLTDHAAELPVFNPAQDLERLDRKYRTWRGLHRLDRVTKGQHGPRRPLI